MAGYVSDGENKEVVYPTVPKPAKLGPPPAYKANEEPKKTPDVPEPTNPDRNDDRNMREDPNSERDDGWDGETCYGE